MMVRKSFLTVFIVLLCLPSCKKDDEPQTPVVSAFNPTSGSVGKAVTISGKNFTGASVVTFNGTPAVVTSVTSGNLQTTVPEGATTGAISVANGDLTATSVNPFTVLLPVADDPAFYFGADLSYVNQILDHGGVYKDGDQIKSPYRIFKDHGTD